MDPMSSKAIPMEKLQAKSGRIMAIIRMNKVRHVLDTLYIALAKLLLLVTFTRNLQQNEKRKKLAPVVIQLQLLSLDNEFHARSGRVRVREVVSRLVYMKEYRNMSRARLVSISGYYNHRLRENT
jgi:hypothetical protein